MGAETAHAGGRGDARAGGGARRRLFRQRLRHHLPRPPAQRGGRARAARSIASRSPRWSRSPRCAWSPASSRRWSSTRLAPVAHALVGAAMPAQSAIAWLSIAPIAESRSSYNGLLVFLFIVASAALARRLRSIASPPTRCAGRRPGTAAFPSRARRRNTPPTSFASRSAACSAASSSAPASGSTCRRRARRGRRGIKVAMRDPFWDAFYAPLVARGRRDRRRGSTGCSSSPSANISASSSRRWSTLLLVLAAWP